MIDATLRFDAVAEIDRVAAFVRGEVEGRGARGVVLGLSGGLDSTTCAYLCRRCLRSDQIHLLNLPERDSAPQLRARAHEVARTLELPLAERSLSDLFRHLGLYERVTPEVAANRRLLERAIRILRWLSGSPSLYPWAQGYAFGTRRGFLASVVRRWLWQYAGIEAAFIFGKVRARALVLALEAMQRDCLLLCTTDRSEWSVGFYDPHGDGIGDLAPLAHLYKTQIRDVARALGVADAILNQPSSGDLGAALPNETALGLRYEQLDRVLAGLSGEMDEQALAAASGVSPAMVRAIRSACRLADERRAWPARLAPGPGSLH